MYLSSVTEVALKLKSLKFNISYMASQVICENPRVIINPSLPNLLGKMKHYFMCGKEYRLHYGIRHPENFDFHPFSVRRNFVTKDNIDNFFVVDDNTGETYPMYLLVPCGHCDICKVSKINSFVKRCEYETLSYDFKPWFGTLTYSQEPECGVSVRDVQLFLKRFRQNLKRVFGQIDPIRYVVVGEYGKTTHRAHYHFIFWNIQAKTQKEYAQVTDILAKSWNNGYIQRRLLDPKDDKGFFYTAKYLKKDCVVPEGKNHTFIVSSRGKGGIGSRFIDKIAPELRRTCNVEFKYFNKWKNKVCKLQFSRYLLNRVFPSFCRSVSSQYRQCVQHLALVSNIMSERIKQQTTLFQESFQIFLDGFKVTDAFYSKYFYTGFGASINHVLPYSDLDLYNDFVATRDRLTLFEQKRADFGFFKKIADRRTFFLGKLFRYVQNIDIDNRAYQCKLFLSWRGSGEVL